MRPTISHLLTSLLVIGATLVSAGCGSDAEPRGSSARGKVAATSPGAFAGTGRLLPSDRVTKNRKITYRPIARYTGRVAIAQRAGLLAVAVGGPDALELRVSDQGLRPRRAEGAGPIPVWAEIHVGRDEGGNPLVTYPRCTGATVATCDVFAWSVASRSEAKLEGLSLPGRAETEAVVDGDDQVVAIELVPATTMDGMRVGDRPASAVLGRKTGSRRLRVIVASKGRDVAVGGGLIGALAGGCGQRAQLIRRSGRRAFKYALGCDGGGHGRGASIEDGHFRFARSEPEGTMTVFDYRLEAPTKAVRTADLSIPADDWAAIDGKSGFAVAGLACDGRWEGSPSPRDTCLVTKVTGLRLRRR